MLTRLSSSVPLLLLLTACALIAGCSFLPQYPDELLAIDNLTLSKPDSALMLLQDLEPRMKHETEPVHRYYQLLTIKARDKAFLPHSSDSLILALLHYYENGGDPRLLPEAYYYAGRVTSDLGDAPQATDYFHKALDAIDDEDYQCYREENEREVMRLKGRIHVQTARILVLQNLYDLAIPEYQEAMKFDSLIGNASGLISDYRNLGHALLQGNKYKEALYYIKESQRLALDQKDSARYTTALFEEINVLIDIGEFEQANRIVEQDSIIITPANNSFIIYTLANLACKKDYEEKALDLYSSLLTSGSLNAKINANHWLANHALSKDRTEEAFLFQNRAIQLYDSLQTIENDASVSFAQSVYNYQLRERENQKLKANESRMKQRMNLMICASLIIILAGIHLYRKEKRKRIEARNQYQQIKYLLDIKEIEAATTRTTREVQLSQLLKSEAMGIVLEKIKQKKVLTDSEWEVIESGVKTYLPDFLRDLHSVHTYSQKERQMSILTKMGVTPVNIAILLGRSPSAIYNMRTRLFEKVFVKVCPYEDWEEFVKSL